MTLKQLLKFLEYLQSKFFVVAPQRLENELALAPLENPKKVELTNELPLHSFKKFLVPPQEVLFEYRGTNAELKRKRGTYAEGSGIKVDIQSPAQVLFGLTILDLKAITMLDQVFASDPYYQKRLAQTLIIGHSLMPAERSQFFIEDFKEDILEHLKFDIFLAIQKGGFRVCTGSEDGQRTLENFGYKDFAHIEYVGPIREEGPDKQMLKIKKVMEENPNHPLWEELGKKCIECGKCTAVCPTCFCFDLDDEPSLEVGNGKRVRHWGSCFYTDFSEVAGSVTARSANTQSELKPKFLGSTAQRIKFWYEHKFVRIPHEFSIPGCVGCGRCTKVCPVGIDIKKNLQRLLKGKVK